MFVFPKVISQLYHVPNNFTSRCEDQIINPEYLRESLIVLIERMPDK